MDEIEATIKTAHDVIDVKADRIISDFRIQHTCTSIRMLDPTDKPIPFLESVIRKEEE